MGWHRLSIEFVTLLVHGVLERLGNWQRSLRGLRQVRARRWHGSSRIVANMLLVSKFMSGRYW
jgi:hypothetical protein